MMIRLYISSLFTIVIVLILETFDVVGGELVVTNQTASAINIMLNGEAKSGVNLTNQSCCYF